jgi:hypothetical protein
MESNYFNLLNYIIMENLDVQWNKETTSMNEEIIETTEKIKEIFVQEPTIEQWEKDFFIGVASEVI